MNDEMISKEIKNEELLEEKIREEERHKERMEIEKKRNKIECIKAGVLFLIFLAIIFHALFCCRCPIPNLNDVEKYVYDEDGHAIRHATVTLAYNENGSEVYDVKTTNCHGRVVFHNVPYGTYYLNVTYYYDGEWYYGDEDWEEVVVDGDKTICNYLSGLHIGEYGVLDKEVK